ncbi:MAG: (2Fe-2S) ferredoxin domain-containing protein [Pseudomonadota bacterium]
MKKLLVCTNYRGNPNTPSCAARGSKSLLSLFSQQCQENNLIIQIEESPCLGFCQIGPNVRLVPSGAFFHGVLADELSAIIGAAKESSEN